MTTRRQRQVAEQIHHELSLIIQRRVHDPRLKPVTVTGVEISPDLLNAVVYVSVLGSQTEAQQALAGLNSAAGFLRRELSNAVVLRFMPQLIFRFDRSLERAMRIEQLLAKIREERPATDHDDE